METTTRILFCVLVLLLLAAENNSAAENPDSSIISHTADGQVILRSRRPSGGVADFLPYAPDELLVRFKDNIAPAVKSAVHARHKAIPIKRFRHTRNLELVKLPQGADLHRALKSYRDQRDVLYAEPNYLIEQTSIIISNPGTPPPGVIPNDPSFPAQWNLHNTGQDGGTPGADIKAAEAWSITTGSNDVVVAVIDSGIDYNHQDLAANMWRNEADCNNNGIDDDGDGYIDDCYGIDTFNDDSDPMDDNDHGTHVAGIIGAVGNNGLGVVGVNWNVKIMACKFMGSDGFGTVADAIDCLEYVQTMKDRGVNIVATNNSWGAYGYSQALYDAIAAQISRGILFIAAAGNYAFDNDNIPLYPASYELPNVISVGASDEFDQFAYFTNYGRATVHLLAPGSDILSTTPQNTYASFSGTSMAAPHVTGIAALLKSQDPLRDWRAIKNLILTGGSDLPSFDKNFLMTAKRASAYGSLTCSNSIVYGRLSPRGHVITTRLVPVKIAVQHINCAKPNGNVSLTVKPGNFKVLLKDDGIAPDQVVGDGIYTGFWLPTAGGEYTIQFPDGNVMPDQDSLKIFVDPDLEPGFPVKTFHGPGTYMGGQALHTLVADIDGDQRPEIIVTGLATGPLYAWKFDGSPVTGWPLEEVLGAGYPAAAELSSSWPGAEVPAAYFGLRPAESFVSANSGDGTVLPGWPHKSANYYVRPPIIADFDRDGIDEIVVGEGDNRVHIYKTDGTEFSGWSPLYDHVPLGVADLDGDGDLEIITVSANSIFAYHHNGLLVDGFPVLLDGSFIGGFAAIGDVDGDGKLEIVIPSFFPPVGGGLSEYGIQIISWDGIIKRRIMAAGVIYYTSAPALADLDGDGVPEIILQTDGALNVWRGDGSNFPGWPVEVPGWMFSSSPVVGDVDGDGLPEIVITSSPVGSGIWGSIWVFYRDGALDPRFPKTLFIGEGAVPAIADIDGDGRNEIIVTGDYWDGSAGDYDKVWVYDLGGTAHGPVQWGQFMGSPKHQGVYRGGYTIPKRFLLAVRKEGTGSGTVTSDVAGINCGSDCSEAFSTPTVVSLTAVAAPNSIFLGWHGAGCGGVGSCSVPVSSDAVVTATFAPQVTGTTATLYVRSLNPNVGADITVSQADIFGQGNAPSPFNRTYYNNVSLTLSAATTAGGNVFQKWLRDGVDWSTSPTTQVFMAADHSMTAVYAPQLPARTLTVASSKPNSGVPITVTPNDENGQANGVTQFTRSYNNDTPVTLTAPATLAGNRFVNWSGCNSSSGTTCNVFLSGDKTVTAAYLPDDGIPPETNIINGPSGTIETHTVTFNWTGSDNLAPTANLLYAFQLKPVQLSFSRFDAWTTVTFSGLSNGEYTFSVKALDEAGNEDPTPATVTFTVLDTTVPDTTITAHPPALSNRTTGNFSFTSTEESTFQCSIDGSGFFGCSSPLDYQLAAGTHTFQVRARDPSGNVDPTPASYTWTIDPTPPDTTITSGPIGTMAINSATFSWGGTDNLTSTADLSYAYRLDPVEPNFSSFGVATNKSYSDLADGIYTFLVKARDQAGNEDSSPAAWTFTVNVSGDTTPPETIITAGPAGSITINNPLFNAIFSWIGADNITPTAKLLYAYRLAPLETSYSAFGAATTKTYSSLAPGSYTFLVKARDQVGNEDVTPAARAFTVILDTSPPDTTITSGPDALTDRTAVSFTFTATEVDSTFQCSLDGIGFSDCASPQNYTGLMTGPHTFRVRAKDGVGNTDATPATYTWTILPDTIINAAPAAATNSTSASFSFISTGSSSTFLCSLDGAAFATCTSPKSYARLKVGNHNFQVRAMDPAGNMDPTPASVAWTIDKTNPNTVIQSSPPGLTNNPNATFSFTSTEAESTFQCSVDGGIFESCTSPWNTATLLTGKHTFQVRAVDPAGNPDKSPAKFSWTVDTTPPDTLITKAPANLTTVKNATFIFKSSESKSTFECSVDGAAFTSCKSGVTYSFLVPIGNHNFQVRAIDMVGNIDPTPATFNWTIQ